MNLDQALQTFLGESRELLQDMEDSLLRMDQGRGEAEDLNAAFRAAHTIKGSAGLFGLDAVVAFTHAMESLLDVIRRGELAVSGALTTLFLECCDHLRALMADIAEGADAAGTAAAGQALIGLTPCRRWTSCNPTPATWVSRSPSAVTAPRRPSKRCSSSSARTPTSISCRPTAGWRNMSTNCTASTIVTCAWARS